MKSRIVSTIFRKPDIDLSIQLSMCLSIHLFGLSICLSILSPASRLPASGPFPPPALGKSSLWTCTFSMVMVWSRQPVYGQTLQANPVDGFQFEVFLLGGVLCDDSPPVYGKAGGAGAGIRSSWSRRFFFFFVVHATQFMDLGWWQAVAGGGQFVD